VKGESLVASCKCSSPGDTRTIVQGVTVCSLFLVTKIPLPSVTMRIC